MTSPVQALLSKVLGSSLGDPLRLRHPETERTKIAHRHSLAIFTADAGITGNFAVEIGFVLFYCRENEHRRSLASFDRSLRAQRLKKIQDLPPGFKFSSEIENFKRATYQDLYFVGNSEDRD